jgi:hypothetical protein
MCSWQLRIRVIVEIFLALELCSLVLYYRDHLKSWSDTTADWPIDPLVPRNLRLEIPEKLPQAWVGVEKVHCCLSRFPRGRQLSVSQDFGKESLGSSSLVAYTKL